MTEDYLKKLEFNEIKNMVIKHCNTYLGKEKAQNLSPIFNKIHVQNLLNETSEALNLSYRKSNPPIYEIADITIYIKSLKSNNSLSARALLEIANILKLSRELKDYFYKDPEFDLSDFSMLDEYFSQLYTNLNIENKIFTSIIDEDNISDDASSKLSSLRRNRRKLEADIKNTLGNMIHSSTYSKYIMEPIITIRNDRYVIPVKEEYRGNIKGFIHDMSASGSTVFVEPMTVFEMNNKINNLKIEENLEIEQILKNLSSLLFSYINELSSDVNLIGTIDFIFAKASFSKSINGVCPKINNNKQINLLQARHPLIDKEAVVPIDIEIGSSYTSLIITGPNTGGKTVTLKTAGLLCIMAYCGLFIPANESSSIYVFDNVFADIGDEQSIQESLSTFSSHMKNIIKITENITNNSLVLLDELGSGTDPVEGANLAISILEYFNKLGAITIATTHYQEIKKYALITEGFENASSEFDIENLKPTYKLLIGIPGKSNAFEISKKLGLSDNILDRAKELLNNDDISIEELLKNIYDDKLKIEEEKENIQKNSNQIELLRKSLEKDNSRQKENEQKLSEKAKIEAQNIILTAKQEANDIIKELDNIYIKFKHLEDLDINSLDDTQIANIVRNNFSSSSLAKANKLRNKLNNSLSSIYAQNNNIQENKISKITKNDLKIGMTVNLKNIAEPATVYSLSGKSNSLQVQIGNAKLNIKVSDILNISNNLSKNITNNINFSNSNYNSISKSKNVLTEINVIGQNVDEAIFVIDKYLDDCYISKLSPVRIVHGKGTGKLREGIHTFLKKHPHVKSFRLGTFGEGEMGVTVVTLKE